MKIKKPDGAAIIFIINMIAIIGFCVIGLYQNMCYNQLKHEAIIAIQNQQGHELETKLYGKIIVDFNKSSQRAIAMTGIWHVEKYANNAGVIAYIRQHQPESR